MIIFMSREIYTVWSSGWGGVLYRIFDKTPILSGEPVEITDIRKGAHASMQGTQQYGESTTAFFVGRRSTTHSCASLQSSPLQAHLLRPRL